jgi:hypothetical protein
MKLTKETLEILSSFKDINQSIVVYPGQMIRTRSEDNRIVAEAIVEETFEREFAFYSIKGFLDAHNIIGSPDLVFSEEDYVLLKDGRSEIRYYYANPDLITAPEQSKVYKIKSTAISFELSQIQLNKMMRMTTFDSDRTHWLVNFVGDGSEIHLVIQHKDDPTMPSYNTVVGETSHTFCIKTLLDCFSFINGSYEIHISVDKGFALEAKNTARNLRYLMALSPDSTFET